MNDRLPAGLRITACVELPKGAKSLGRAATEAVYRSRSRTARRARSASRSRAQAATTPKKFLEKEYGVPPEGQHAVRVTRHETVLAVVDCRDALDRPLPRDLRGRAPSRGLRRRARAGPRPLVEDRGRAGDGALGAYDLSVDFVPTEALVKAARRAPPQPRPQHRAAVRPEERERRERRALGRGRDPRRPALLKNGVRLEEVTVWEGPRNSVTYRPD